MKCLGRTDSLARCRRDARFLVCHSHRYQPWTFLFFILTLVGLFGGIYQDVFKPAFAPPVVSLPQDRRPASDDNMAKTFTVIATLQEGSRRDFVETALGPPMRELESPIQNTTAYFYDLDFARILTLYDATNKLECLAVQALSMEARHLARMPKPHSGVGMDFTADQFAETRNEPQLIDEDFDPWNSYGFGAATPREFKYAEYHHYGGPHYDQCCLGLSSQTCLPPSDNQEFAKLRAYPLDVIAYFPMTLLWSEAFSSSSEGSSPEPLREFASFLADEFELISY